MRTVAYYRQRAAECRTIAKQISLKEPRDQLLKMAQEWEGLAADREAELRKKAESSADRETVKAAGE